MSVVKMPRPSAAAVSRLFEPVEGTLILTVLQGHMGEVFADDTKKPVCAMAKMSDLFFPAGDAAAASAEELIAFAEGHVRALGERDYFLMVPADEAWAALIEKTYPAFKALERYAVEMPNVFNVDRLTGLTRLPEGYEIAKIGREIYPVLLAEKWSRDFVSNFEDCGDFLSRGLGFVITCAGEPVGGASTFSVFDKGFEIQVDIIESHRRRGLASAVCARLIFEGLARGLEPHWDAANMASVGLAQKLGYRLKRKYKAYSVGL